MVLWLAGAALAEEGGWQAPNSVVGVAVGTPTTWSVRGQAWFADEGEGELGVGVADLDDPNVAFDWAVRWRPDFACIGCGERVLVTIGLGAGGLVTPPPGWEGPWAFAVGPDLGANGVFWMSNKVGLELGGRVGFGPGWVGTDFDTAAVEPWAFLSLGLAF